VHRQVVALRRPHRIAGSRRLKRGSKALDEAAPVARVEVVIHLRNPARVQPPDASAEDLDELSAPVTRRTLARRRALEYAPAENLFRSFARKHRLTVHRVDLTRRTIRLTGTPDQLKRAFGAALGHRRIGDHDFLARTGYLSVPATIAPWTRAVLGLDQRPYDAGLATLATSGNGPGLWPSEVAALYGIPADLDASGQTVGILALGGGYQLADLEAACARMGRPVPQIIDKSVDGTTNLPLTGGREDLELALDMQVIAGVASVSRIVVYFASNKVERIPSAIAAAALDSVNRPSVLSISWGSPEKFWHDDVVETARAALRDANRVGVTVVAAAGDGLATCGLSDQQAHVCFPASSPYVLACGGTSLALSGNAIASEAVWNEVTIGTGGGVSDLFSDIPDFQAGLALPTSPSSGKPGRGLPDVAAAAANDPGYRIIFIGGERHQAGTSAVAPLWAALIAAGARAAGRPLGIVHPRLYQNPNLFRPVTSGNNRLASVGYDAGVGWDACTGLGTPVGGAIVAGLAG
jgi:kumamolisin